MLSTCRLSPTKHVCLQRHASQMRSCSKRWRLRHSTSPLQHFAITGQPRVQLFMMLAREAGRYVGDFKLIAGDEAENVKYGEPVGSVTVHSVASVGAFVKAHESEALEAPKSVPRQDFERFEALF